ncbi:site-specific integrase [Paucibacter sp. TC2R-5]|uniref:site-specific integrase n=1 Tax=Paucibacter sp. TC2R-5 TaxID=2893555 RepID=UPI0021E4C2D6|nr:site-specific integrase [Paucibacter sp. TC2R-5]MCV2357645.1 site-specific integrase [Paucibacter sp. TC2R-5]
MKRNSNVKRRERSTFKAVRLYVPAWLQKAVGKKEVSRTTGCRDPRLAKIVIAEMVARWHAELDKYARMDLSKIEAGTLDLLGEGYIHINQAAALLGSDDRTLVAQLLANHARFYVYAENWDGWFLEDMDALWHDRDASGLVSVDVSETALRRLGQHRKESRHLQLRFDEDVRAIHQGAQQPREVCCFMLPPSRQMGFVVEMPGRPISAEQLMVSKADVEQLRCWLASQITPAMAAQASEQRPLPLVEPVYLGLAHARHANVLLAEILATYIDRNKGKWKPNTLHTNQDRCAILLELTGNPPLRDIDRDFLWRLVEKLKALPDGRQHVRRRFKCPEATFTQLIALAEQHDLPRLTTKAVEKLIDGFGEIFTWAVTQTYLTANPATKLGTEVFESMGGKRTKASDDRDQLSPDDLALIFSTEWFVRGTGTKTKQGLFYSYRPHYYWLPLLGLLAGGRLNELAQLYLSDIRCSESGVNYLDFNLDGEDKVNADTEGTDTQDGDGLDKSLKTINAIRQVPIHPKLIELGFIDYVVALRGAGYTRLFPELGYDKTKGYGKYAGSWFNERFLGTQLKIERNGRKTFHSFRHNFSTALGDSEIPAIIKSQLMGHSRGKAQNESRYDKGRHIDQLAEHLSSIDFGLTAYIKPFSVIDGIQAAADALKLKTTRQRKSKRDA